MGCTCSWCWSVICRHSLIVLVANSLQASPKRNMQSATLQKWASAAAETPSKPTFGTSKQQSKATREPSTASQRLEPPPMARGRRWHRGVVDD